MAAAGLQPLVMTVSRRVRVEDGARRPWRPPGGEVRDVLGRRHPGRIRCPSGRICSFKLSALAMAHQSQSSRTGVPLGDLTNTYQRGDTVRHGELHELEDSKARKNQRQRERYAAMSRENKEVKNRMQRERQMKKKAQAIDVSVSMHENEENDWLHRGCLTGNSYLRAGGEVLSNAETNGSGIDESCIDTTEDNGTQDGGEILIGAETNEEGIECTNVDNAWGNILTGAEMNEDDIEGTIADRGPQ